jgi:hypothetical protein
MAIMLQESNAKQIRIGDKQLKAFTRSYGPMQVRLGTYYYLKNKKYILSDHGLKEDVLMKLMTDSHFNVAVGTYWFKYMLTLCKDYKKAVRGYNTGTCKKTEAGEKYYASVSKKIKYIQNINLKKYLTSVEIFSE